jgi:hypothetical protein
MASAIEAIAEQVKDKKWEPATAEDVKACLVDAGKGKCAQRTRSLTWEPIFQYPQGRLWIAPRLARRRGSLVIGSIDRVVH